MKSKLNSLILLVIAALTFPASPASADIWYVDGTASGDGTSWPEAFETITEAIAVAADTGDEIWVKAGTYALTSHIQVDKAVGIYGGFAGAETARSQRDWANNTTTIDGQNTTRIIKIANEPVIDGFTLSNGYYTSSVSGGGSAIYMGGIGALGKTARINNCIISNNTVYADPIGTEGFKGGGAIFIGTGNPIFTNCLITNNSTNAYGGAINLYAGSPNFTNCTISKNNALKGGGAYLQGADTILNAEFYNCIVSGNTSTSDANDLKVKLNGDPPQGTNNCSSVQIGTGTLLADPLFVNPDSDDFHLQPGSPCIDAGDNSAPSIPPTDYDGNNRIIDGDSNGSVIVDIGAYEFTLEGVVVPNVLNMTESAAQTALEAVGLVKGNVTHDYSDTVAAGLVMNQDPDAGTSVPDGSEVDLVISDGPCVVDVPNVLNMTESAAQTALEAVGLVKGNVTHDYSDTVAAGLVMDQDPDAGTTVACGSAVDLVISDGPCVVDVPNVLNMTEVAAGSALIAAGLVKGTVTHDYSDTVAAGLVMDQDPDADTTVACSSAVNLVISDGSCVVDVPNVLNMAEADAQTALNAVGLLKGAVTTATSDTVAAGLVMDQDPDAGTTVACGSAVDLVISNGPCEIDVPNVLNMTEAEAETALNAVGLTKGALTHSYSNTVDADLVANFAPPAGTFVPCGSAVDLVISDGLPIVSNDLCDSPETVAAGVDYPGSTVGATGTSASTCSGNDSLDVWYSYTASADGLLNITLVGSDFDTTLAVYDNCGGVELACNDDFGDPVIDSRVTLFMSQDTNCLIRVAGYDDQDGDFTLSIDDDPPGPDNDTCAFAIPVEPNEIYLGTTVEATGTSESGCSYNDTLDVWHSFTPQENILAQISLCGSDFDTTLAVYDECGGRQIGCNDDYCGIQSLVTVNLTANNPYRIRVAGYDGETGDYTLTITELPGWKPDFNQDGLVDYGDFAILAIYWQTDRPSVDIAPQGGDGIIDTLDLNKMAVYWLE